MRVKELLQHGFEIPLSAGKAAEIGGPGTHAFMHTYRSWLDAVRTPIAVQQKMMRHADIRGMSIMTLTADDLRPVHKAIGEGLAKGDYRPIVGKEIPLAEAARAHEEIMKPGAYGKIVLIP